MSRGLIWTSSVCVALFLACGDSGTGASTGTTITTTSPGTATGATGTTTTTGTGTDTGTPGTQSTAEPPTTGDPTTTTDDPTTTTTDATSTSSTTGVEGPNEYVSCDMCPPGWAEVGVGGPPCVCAPPCDANDPMCPPAPVDTVEAICWDTIIGGTRCGLACPGEGQDDACPTGMVCLNFSGNVQLGGCLAPGCPTCMWP